MNNSQYRRRTMIPGRVSVVTAVYNAAETLTACIESVSNQDYHDIEHILMDGGSTDGSVGILQSFGERVVWRTAADGGIYDAWNKSINLATGEWIAFLGADDVYLPGALSAYMAFISGKTVEYVSSRVMRTFPGGRSETIGESWIWPKSQRVMTVAHVGSLHHFSIYETYGNYDLSYRIVGDYELLLRAGKNLRSLFCPYLTVKMRAGGVSDSFSALRETERAKVLAGKLNPIVAMYDLSVAYIKLLIRRILKPLLHTGGR